MPKQKHPKTKTLLTPPLTLSATLTTTAETTNDQGAQIYTTTVHPILQARCLHCHDTNKKRGGLDLTTPNALHTGGDTGPAILPGDPDNSLLIKLLRHQQAPYMPHKEPQMPQGEIDRIAQWITAGAAAPQQTTQQKTKKELQITDKDRQFWSYQPLTNPTPPPTQDTTWPQNPIDQFILTPLEKNNLTPAPKADRRTLLRRAYYDLIGLPPTPEEIENFLHDPAPDAWERQIDKLLASPHYGERWGRHWLDLARYADSDGYEFDKERPNAFPYRDFVIRAFNQDMPFDQFIRWQIAGDEYHPNNPDALAATGFLAAGPIIDNQELELNRYDELDDIASTVGAAFLATNVGCARCHDHKYDPLPTRDYYRFLSAFTTTRRYEAPIGTPEENARYRERQSAWERALGAARKSFDEFRNPLIKATRNARIEALQITEEEKALLRAPTDGNNPAQKTLLERFDKELKPSDADVRQKLTTEQIIQWDALHENIQKLEREKPTSPPLVLAITDKQPEPVESYLLARGNPDMKTEPVRLGFLSVLPGNGDTAFEPSLLKPADAPTTYNRRAVAEWITNLDRGAGRLSARVLANRLWHYHFGDGIVRTPNDFGMQGDRPSHPELLEWLAREIIRHDWRIKPLHRTIMTSATYQMSTEFDEAKAAADPENRLWWRRKPQRVEAEIMRDAILKVSGALNPLMYGPGIYPAVPADAVTTGSTPKWPTDVVDGPGTWRRSIYAFVRRSARMPLLEAFDTPDPASSAGRRLVTTTPTQGLELMNSAFINEQARILAERVRAEAWQSRGAMIDRVYLLAYGRPPEAEEHKRAMAFLERQAARYPSPKDQTGTIIPGTDPFHRALQDFCQVTLCSNEFVYIN